MQVEVEEIKKKVTYEHLSAYVQSVQHCTNLQDLITPTKTMFQQVASLIVPKYRVEYVPLDMPQDILKDEEYKDEITSE